MKVLKGKNVIVRDGDLKRREETNRNYLMSLTNDNLLFNYRVEAGRFHGREIPRDAHGGWETPVCQIRGHFLGHWLSAAALEYDQSGDLELKVKADQIIKELAECQKDNGGQWIGPIPEKYLHLIAKGKQIWAPQYNLHKLFMGLVDMYTYTDNHQALEIADQFADWFVEWSESFTRKQFDDILDVETGGMLEVWADLLAITQNKKYEFLLEKYYRQRLFKPLLEGKDPLTNMHANTTIPEVLGCARAYEVTGEQRWLDIVHAYWACAVTERGTLATGGNTSGEVWMPKMKIKARLGDKNQEFCTVYNMIRLADFLFQQTKDPSYGQYIEYNLYNGIMAQAYHQSYHVAGTEKNHPWTGLLTYFLPMKAGLHKEWSSETNSFFCCHGTMVQANAKLNRGIYYQNQDEIYVSQYFHSELETTFGGDALIINQTQDFMNGSMLTSSTIAGQQKLSDTTSTYENTPDFKKYDFTINLDQAKTFTLALRIPEWIMSEASIYVNDELVGKTTDSQSFYKLTQEWSNGDKVSITFPIGLRFIPLPDDENTGAFRFGPDVLAGICEHERILHLESDDPTEELVQENEREWGSWRYFFKTTNQDPGIQFSRIRDIGYDPYQVYFTIKK
ncbi:beta-L-arabinofuranosidase domain-containing protein [Amphibacillus indicireducens]|uniref:Glycoside hydrolase family 127 protein n=1 Tax=Amphibacillus indicireducens TaxID=1076330 RepID=A0ABP7V429_9BACI